jgi:NADPH2:quinone reductase
MLPSLWLMQNSITLRLFLIYEISQNDREQRIDELTKLLGSRQITHTISRRLPLDAIADAHDIVEKGETMGNVVLDIA